MGRLLSRSVPFVFTWLLLFPAWALAQAGSLPDFTELAKNYSKAVVNISTKQSRQTTRKFHGLNIPDLPEDSPLREFFDRFFGQQGRGGLPDEEILSRSLGSGFIISPDGYVLTDHHVVSGADEIVVRTSDRREFLAKVVGSDKRSDIALLKIDAKDLPTVKIGTAKDLRVGEWVLAIGSPFGFDHSVTAGIVSAKGRSLPSENYVPFIQTDVAINPGNSGGPLIDMDGNVVGINSQIYSRTGGFMGLSFAIPIDVAMNVVQQIKTTGHVRRGWLGVMIQDVTRELAETFGMKHPRGALIAQVLPDSPASNAGLRVGDVILEFQGQALMTSSELPPLVGASPVDEPARLLILRNGKKKTMKVDIGELPEEGEVAMSHSSARRPQADRLGLTVEDIPAEQRSELGLGDKGGVLVSGVKDGPAHRAGIQSGDIVLMLNNREIGDAAQFKELVNDLPAGKSVAMLVQRDDGRLFLPLRVPAK